MFKTQHNFKIKRLNGELIDLYDIGVMVLGFDDPIPELTYFEDTAEGIEGHFDLGAELQGRTPAARFYIQARDLIAYSLQIQKVYRLFDSREPFYIIRDVQPGKQLLVRRAGGFLPALDPGYSGEFAISFKSASPYWESIADTTEPVDFTSSLWAIGMGLETDKTYQYKFENLSEFKVYNPGNAVIDPRIYNRPFKIEIKGTFTGLELINQTTGETFKFGGTVAPGYPLVIDRVKVLKNGTSVFASTNRSFISLKKGENNIMIKGMQQLESPSGGTYTYPYSVEFVTKFYYL